MKVDRYIHIHTKYKYKATHIVHTYYTHTVQHTTLTTRSRQGSDLMYAVRTLQLQSLYYTLINS